MDTQASKAKPTVVVGIGEVLFDCFPDRAILGGAPANFAVQMQQLLDGRGESVVVSRVGNDDLGRQVMLELESRNTPVRGIQIDRDRPTGVVHVTISKNGDPQYEIVEEVAWDYLEFDDSLCKLAAECNAVCFGTLAKRSSTSRDTIRRFLDAAPNAIRLLDVNLRQHYATPEILESCLLLANAAKLNEEELERIVMHLPHYFRGAYSVDDRVKTMLRAFDLKILALTRGARGTVLYADNERLEGTIERESVDQDADSVGAGDACSAGLVFGLLNNWPLERTLELANRMGAYVASRTGGTPKLPRALIEFARQD